MRKTEALEEVLSYFNGSSLTEYKYTNTLQHCFKFYKRTDDDWVTSFAYNGFVDCYDGWFELYGKRFMLNKFELMLLKAVVKQHMKHASYI